MTSPRNMSNWVRSTKNNLYLQKKVKERPKCHSCSEFFSIMEFFSTFFNQRVFSLFTSKRQKIIAWNYLFWLQIHTRFYCLCEQSSFKVEIESFYFSPNIYWERKIILCVPFYPNSANRPLYFSI